MRIWLTFPLILVLVLFSSIGAQSSAERPPNIDIDRYYGYSEKDEAGLLDLFLVNLSNSNDRGVIDLEFKFDRKRKVRIERIRRILKHIRHRKFDVQRLSFRISEGPEDALALLSDSIPFKGLIEADEQHLIINASKIESKFKMIFPVNK